MPNITRSLLSWLLGLAGTASTTGCAPPPTLPPSDATPLELGRTYTAWLYEGHLDALWERLAPELRSLFGGRQALASFRREILSGAGTEPTRRLAGPWSAASRPAASASAPRNSPDLRRRSADPYDAGPITEEAT